MSTPLHPGQGCLGSGSQVTDNQVLGGIRGGLGKNGRDHTWSQPLGGVGVGLGDPRASYLYRDGPPRAPSHMLKLVVFAGGSALGIPKAKRQLPI